MIVKKKRLTIYVSEHDDGKTFYEFELRNADWPEVVPILTMVLKGILNGNAQVVGRAKVPREEGE